MASTHRFVYTYFTAKLQDFQKHFKKQLGWLSSSFLLVFQRLTSITTALGKVLRQTNGVRDPQITINTDIQEICYVIGFETCTYIALFCIWGTFIKQNNASCLKILVAISLSSWTLSLLKCKSILWNVFHLKHINKTNLCASPK